MPMKVLAGLLFSTLIVTLSYAQDKKAPSLLRVDLLQNAEWVYDQGQRTNVALEQAALAGDKWQFCRVNSRFPTFSWVIAGGHQAAFQLLVASRKELLMKDSADVWNSGRKNDNNSISTLYKGASLQPSTIYYWKVRTWGADDKAGSYSAIQSFCTGKTLEDFSLPSFVLIKTFQLPQQVRQLTASNRLYDFGKDGFSQLQLSVNAQHANDTLVIHLGEALTADGHINRNPPGTVRYRKIKVPLAQGQHTYQPLIPPDKRNTGSNAVLMPADIGEVLPFQYAEIAGVEGKCTIDSVSRYLVTSVFNDDATTFTSSDTGLNKIWDLCKYTIKATSFAGYYVDGDRERIPYEADALINQLSHYASDAEFNMTKRTLDYLIYHPTWPTEWSLQNVLIAWNDYLYSGDLRQVKKLYPELKAKLLTSLAREDGLISTRTGKQTLEFLNSIHYKTFNANQGLKDIVDWPPAGGIGGGQSGVMGETDGFVFTDYNAVVNAWYYAGLEAMAQLSMAVANKQDAAYYTLEAERVRMAFRRSFFDAQTNLVLDGEGTKHSSIHANFFALAFGLVPKEKVTPIVSFIRSRGMACSVYGAQFLLDALYKVNEQEYALKLMTSTEKRSWFNMLREGATMTMEAWGQEYKPNQDWNHAWGTAPANAIVRYLAGIQPLTPGYGEVQIKPQPGTVEQVDVKLRTIRGDIALRFENKKNRLKLQVSLPGNTTGRVYLPFAAKKAVVKMNGKVVKATFGEGYYLLQHVKPGTHKFEVYTD
jgi:alpha-L-rhamnosidase